MLCTDCGRLRSGTVSLCACVEAGLLIIMVRKYEKTCSFWANSRRARVQIAVAMLSGNSLRQTAHTHPASVHQASKLVAALLRVARVTAGLAESSGSLPPGL